MSLEHYRALLAEVPNSGTMERLTQRSVVLKQIPWAEVVGEAVDHSTEPAMH